MELWTKRRPHYARHLDLAVVDGEALIKVAMLSIDPTIRTWMDDAPGYLPPIEVGAVIRGSGTGVVTESRTDRYKVGDVVFGMTNWQEWVLATDENRFSVVPPRTSALISPR